MCISDWLRRTFLAFCQYLFAKIYIIFIKIVTGSFLIPVTIFRFLSLMTLAFRSLTQFRGIAVNFNGNAFDSVCHAISPPFKQNRKCVFNTPMPQFSRIKMNRSLKQIHDSTRTEDRYKRSYTDRTAQ